MRSAFVLLLAAIGSVGPGCGLIDVSPTYAPTRYLHPVATGRPTVKLVIRDGREREVFYTRILGEGRDDRRLSLMGLARPAGKIVESGFAAALQSLGIYASEHATVIYEVTIERFMAIDDNAAMQWRAEVAVVIRVKQFGTILATRRFSGSQSVHDEVGAIEHLLIGDMLTESLSKVIDRAMVDANLLATIEQARNIETSVASAHQRLDQLPPPAKPDADRVAASSFETRAVTRPGRHVVKVTNDADEPVVVYLSGPTRESATVAPHSTWICTVQPGTYHYAATVPGVESSAGKRTFEAGRYTRWILSLHPKQSQPVHKRSSLFSRLQQFR